jgi:predicted nucleic acid-binding protein
MSIIYLDTSALLKRYVEEKGTRELSVIWPSFDVIGTALITQAEIGAALSKAQRLKWIQEHSAQMAWEQFLQEWALLTLIDITPLVINRAGDLVWKYPLRGYDAVHLAAALSWQDLVGEEITFATFDRQLWNSVRRSGLHVWPEERIDR